jgi:phosphotransferase system  glucose/maltose/N-acetylglucosamine-specific IIC component
VQKVLEIFLEIIGWLQITAGVTFLAGLPALFVVVKYDTATGRNIALIIVILGFVIGVVWATRIWIKHGTINWLSQVRQIS